MTEQLIIVRKRKKWKFAHFDQWPNCFQAGAVTPELWRTYFGAARPLVVEIGAGTADLSIALARRHRDRNYVAVDIKSDRLYTGARIALQDQIPNVAFVRAQLREIAQLFAPRSISELWVTFPDPFPRGKQAKHRLTHPKFLAAYADLLADDGILRFKTDNRKLFDWSLEQLVAAGWSLQGLSFDLHGSELSDEYKTSTHFERRFLAQGIPIAYLSATPKTR